jgi:hypothetical protein
MAQPGKPNPPKATTAAKPVTPAASTAQPAAAAPAAKAQPAAAPQPAAKPAAAAPKPAAKPAAPGVGGSERARMISEAAYYIAQKRGTAGNPLADWLTAEKQIDQQLGQRR